MERNIIGLKVLGLFGVFTSMISVGILLSMNIKYKESFIVIYNLFASGYILFLFISSLGIFFLKKWARMLFIIIMSVKIIESMAKLIFYLIKDVSLKMQAIHFFEQIVNIFIFSLLIYYLTKESTKKLFVNRT